MVFIILFVLFTYMTVGAVYSRKRYANILATAKTKVSDFKAIEVNKKRLAELQNQNELMRSSHKVDTLSRYHKSGCDKIRYPNIGTCDCGALRANEKALNECQRSLDGVIDEPSTFKPMLFWPLYLTEDFIKSGSANTIEAKRALEIEQAEHNAHIAEIRAREAKALDEELKALDLPTSV